MEKSIDEAQYFETFEDEKPVVLPLKTYEAAVKWAPNGDKFCIGTIPLRKRRQNRGPRMLACHDFREGYLDDRFIQGSPNCDAYRFFHWHLIDEFIYFSHYFVTIPPPGWTHAAHLHGVPIYGTIITEWKEGKERCEEFLSSKESYETFAQQLVAIADYYCFDGWLINIENVIEENLVPNLVDFVETLTKKMHEKLPHSRVIWYDSVINTGELKWQNEINDLNSQFFAVCDGLFVNYTWKDENLENSTRIGTELDRLHDLYFGIDVFGRGCRGDGGFNTKEALEAVHQRGLSSAIFAFGWVFEKLGPENFTFNELKFWSLLQQWCSVHPYCELPVSLHFCQGNGQRLKSCGKTLMDKPWSALSLQSMQPQLQSPKVADDSRIVVEDVNVEWAFDDAFHGGSCLRLTGNCGGGSKYFRICQLTEKVESDKLYAGLIMNRSDNVNVALELCLTDNTGPKEISQTFVLDGKQSKSYQELNNKEVSKLLKSFEDILLAPELWAIRMYRLNTPTSIELEELGLQITSKDNAGDFKINLGQVFLFSEKNLEVPLVTGLKFTPNSSQEEGGLTGLLSWRSPPSVVLHYRVFQETEKDSWSYIGQCHTTRFQLDIKVARSQQVKLKVQPFASIALAVNLEHCSAIEIDTKSI